MVVHACNPSYSGGRGRRIMVQGWLRKKLKTLSEKQTKSKRTGGLAQVFEHMHNKCEALSPKYYQILKKER
jgi:hypothetical protein